MNTIWLSAFLRFRDCHRHPYIAPTLTLRIIFFSDVPEVFSGSSLNSVWVVSTIIELKLISLEISSYFPNEITTFWGDPIFADEIVAADAHALLLCWEEKGFVGSVVEMVEGVSFIGVSLDNYEGGYFCWHGDDVFIWGRVCNELVDVLIFFVVCDKAGALG